MLEVEQQIRKQIMLLDESGKRVLGKTKTFRDEMEYRTYIKKVLKDEGVARIIEKTI